MEKHYGKNGFASSSGKTIQKNTAGSPAGRKNTVLFYTHLLQVSGGFLLIANIISIYNCFHYSLDNHIQSVFWNFYSEQLVTFSIDIIGGIAMFIASLLTEKINRTKDKIILITALVSVIALIIWGVINFSCYCKLKSSVEEQIEEAAAAAPTVSISQKEPEYLKQYYSLEDDPFVEHLEEYHGVEKGSIPSDMTTSMMAEIIMDDIAASSADNADRLPVSPEILGQFSTYTILADKQHDTYSYQLTRDTDVTGDAAKELLDLRLSDLSSAKSFRITADALYISPDNRKVTATYCKEEGDEYCKISDCLTALNCYEEGAVWCMKAFYAACYNNDSVKMKEVLNTFATIYVAANDEVITNTIGNNTVSTNIKTSYEAYKLVYENWK